MSSRQRGTTKDFFSGYWVLWKKRQPCVSVCVRESWIGDVAVQTVGGNVCRPSTNKWIHMHHPTAALLAFGHTMTIPMCPRWRDASSEHMASLNTNPETGTETPFKPALSFCRQNANACFCLFLPLYFFLFTKVIALERHSNCSTIFWHYAIMSAFSKSNFLTILLNK